MAEEPEAEQVKSGEKVHGRVDFIVEGIADSDSASFCCACKPSSTKKCTDRLKCCCKNNGKACTPACLCHTQPNGCKNL